MSVDATTEAVDDETAEALDAQSLEAQRDVLLEENQRLREEYARAKRSQYRRTAIGLIVIGALAALGGALFPVVRTVLFALAGIGVFGGLLTLFLTPERFIAADVGSGVYGAMASNEEAVVADLGLSNERVYVPVEDGTRLYVPQVADATVPEDDLDQVFVVTADDSTRGVAFEPTGEPLFEDFERALRGDLESAPEPLAEQLADALVEQFELVDSVGTEVDDEQVTLELTGSAYGDVSQFDHPVVSVVATGLARGLDTSVRTEVSADEDPTIVVCRWDSAE